MPIKKSVYPKTQRVGSVKVQITEKLDGENLVIFKLNGEIFYATRNNIFTCEEVLEGLCGHKGLKEYAEFFNVRYRCFLNEGSAVCGEWMGAVKKRYAEREQVFDFYMFAKARITENMVLENIDYRRDSFKYAFDLSYVCQTESLNAEEIPTLAFEEFFSPFMITQVPLIAVEETYPTTERLNEIYENLRNSFNFVEGFIVFDGAKIQKYVRMKNGKLKPHDPNPGKKK